MELKVELPDELGARLASVAAEQDTTVEALLADTVRWLLTDAAAMEAAIAEGEADVAAGRFVPFEEAMREIDGIIEAARLRRG